MEQRFTVNWEPLIKVLGEGNCPSFMAMPSYLNREGIEVFTYKHSITRRYINVDAEGNFYRYAGNNYEPIDKETALDGFKSDGVIFTKDPAEQPA